MALVGVVNFYGISRIGLNVGDSDPRRRLLVTASVSYLGVTTEIQCPLSFVLLSTCIVSHIWFFFVSFGSVFSTIALSFSLLCYRIVACVLYVLPSLIFSFLYPSLVVSFGQFLSSFLPCFLFLATPSPSLRSLLRMPHQCHTINVFLKFDLMFSTDFPSLLYPLYIAFSISPASLSYHILFPHILTSYHLLKYYQVALPRAIYV